MQGELKGMILSSLLTGERTSNSIFKEVSDNEYEYEMPDGTKQKFTYEGTLNNIRVDILYLRVHKYIRIVNDRIPYIYAITELGKKGAESPFKYLEVREELIEKAVKSRTEGLEAEFESRVKTEVESRIEAEMEKIDASNEDRIATRAKELCHIVMYDKDKRFRDAVREKALENMTQEYIPRGTKLFVGADNIIELNMSTDPKYPHPLVVIIENAKVKESYIKK